MQFKPWHWFAALGLGIASGTIAALSLPKRRSLSGTTPSMLKIIAQEARSPAEFARRAEAWNATEAKPMSITLLAKAYRGAKPGVTAQLIREAHEQRIEQRERHWSRMSKGLRGVKKGSAGPKAISVNKLFAWAPKVQETKVDVDEGRVSRSNDQPIKVSRLDSGGYWIIDGHHRAVEAVRRGDRTVNVVIDEHLPRIERTGGAYTEVLTNRVNVAKSAK